MNDQLKHSNHCGHTRLSCKQSGKTSFNLFCLSEASYQVQMFCMLQVAQAVVQQVASRPVLLNLVRSLAYHKRSLAQEPLTLAQAEKQQHLVNDISDTLRTILCL